MPEVCCRIPEPESTVLDNTGYHLKVPEKPFDIPTRPSPKPYTPQPYSPTQTPYRPTEKPYQQTPKPYQPTPAPYQPTPKPYQPTQAPYQPTQKPYQPTQAPYRPTQPTYKPTAPRIPSTAAPEYLPPTRQPQTRPPATRQPVTRPPITRQPITRQPYVPQPTKPISGDSILSYPIPKNTPRPPLIGNDILNEPRLPPVTCAAALNCTRPEYCSATGVIETSPVSLTPEQELFRVPMTQCQDLQQGFTGVCCRDPNYVDPWPVSQLGQYNAKDFGDDGTYKPNPGISRPQRRANNANKNQKRVVRQKPSIGQCANRNAVSIK